MRTNGKRPARDLTNSAILALETLVAIHAEYGAERYVAGASVEFIVGRPLPASLAILCEEGYAERHPHERAYRVTAAGHEKLRGLVKERMRGVVLVPGRDGVEVGGGQKT